MSNNRSITLAAALIFLALAGVCLYRLLFWFPITIGGQQIGQTMSLFAFAIFAALSLMLFRSGRVRH